MPATINYTERSWTIDVIGEINTYISRQDRRIKRAGGENTITDSTISMFPDVLLFGDSAGGEILQGWELKMPDTSITDMEFINNAKSKAELLRNDSFLLWNAKRAVLYQKNNNDYHPIKYWGPLTKIQNRQDVPNNEDEWKHLCHQIIDDLNNLFVEGVIPIRGLVDSFSADSIIGLLLNNTQGVIDKIIRNVRRNAEFDAKINDWWRSILPAIINAA